MLHGNALEGAPGINICARRIPEGGFQVAVLDEGLGFDLETHEPPDTQLSERGRGIPLIRAFTRGVAMVGGELTMTFA